MPSLGDDVHSYSNFLQVRTTNISLNLQVDFSRKIFYGFVDFDFEVLKDDVDSVLLDAKSLAIENVTESETNSPLLWTLSKHDKSLGLCLNIPLQKKYAKGSTIKLTVCYSTTQASAGIQWFDPSQTSGKKHPFVYTQCQAILARTLLPCQDTPSVKSPYSVRVTCPSPLVACCSGTLISGPTFEEDGRLTYHYKQDNPIPSYLIAIVCGALVKSKVGPRSSVWCEKELAQKAVHEFSEDTEKFIEAGEDITGMPYEWGVYDMVILPGAFPYGGMENPNLTFLSSSLLAGDRSLTNVVAHEIVHSWSGNYTTNSTWKDFWLNEGFTVYIERMILGKVYESSSYRDFESLLGYNDLVKTVQHDTDEPEFTKLLPNLDGIDPDDAFNKIPYEKGSLFLRYLENKVGGIEMMQKWLKKYFGDFRFKSINTDQMKDHFLKFFEGEKVDQKVLNSIEWEHFLNTPGIPSTNIVDVNSIYDKSLSQACIELANLWKQGKVHTGSCKPSDITSFKSKQIMYFLDLLIEQENTSHETIKKLDELYQFSFSKNVEIVYRFLLLCLRNKYKEAIPQVQHFLSKYGRGLYVKPLYKALIDLDVKIAQETLEANKTFYHVIIKNGIETMIKNALTN